MDSHVFLLSLLLALIVATLSLATARADPHRYTLTDLGPHTVTGLADDGTVVGSMAVNGKETAAILFPTPTPLPFARLAVSRARDAAGGHIVGIFGIPVMPPSSAFHWTTTTGIEDLTNANPAMAFSIAIGVNASGTTVGRADNSAAKQVPVVWTPTAGVAELPTPSTPGVGIRGAATAINTAGQIVGYARTMQGTHAYRWVNGVGQDLHTVEGTPSFAYGLNNVGQVVGSVTTPQGTRGFVWLPLTGMLLLPPLRGDNASYALSINDAGILVGSSVVLDAQKVTTLKSTAVVWDNGKPVALRSRVSKEQGWVLESALRVNQAGVIVGMGTKDGQPRSWMLTPVGQQMAKK
jgi:probable HAF family extracellular repeat protein